MTTDAGASSAGQPELVDPQLLSYEQAKDELRSVVQALESGSIPLEDTLELWQRGELLAARCKQILDQAAARVNGSENPSRTDTIVLGESAE